MRKACTIIHTPDIVSPKEKAATALRNGRNSSMRKAIDAVRDEEAAGVVSAGNTGRSDGDVEVRAEDRARDRPASHGIVLSDIQGRDRDA